MNTQDSRSPAKKLNRLSKAKLIARLDALPCAPGHSLECCPVERLRMDVGAHQIELEAQNQELRESQMRAEEARDRYTDLYDFAPVGYVTLDRYGHIREINLAGAELLGRERKAVLGQPLLRWLTAQCHAGFQEHLRRVCAAGDQVSDELTLRSDDGTLRNISMASSALREGQEAGFTCRTALLDITGLKQKELALTRSRKQLRELAAHLDRARENERRHLAREIHDELGQKLTALRFEVALLAVNGNLRLSLPDTAAALLKLVDETIEAVRNIASDLRPAVLDLGLVAAIDWQLQQLRRRTGIATVLNASDEEINLDDEARATAVFRIIQESLTNIVRHADADQVEVSLHKTDGSLHIRVADNGVGMAADALRKAKSFGIAGMRERVLLLGGELTISGQPGRGTRLHLSIPLHDRRSGERNGGDHDDDYHDNPA
jgi:PAS domain S-box-containing protein